MERQELTPADVKRLRQISEILSGPDNHHGIFLSEVAFKIEALLTQAVDALEGQDAALREALTGLIYWSREANDSQYKRLRGENSISYERYCGCEAAHADLERELRRRLSALNPPVQGEEPDRLAAAFDRAVAHARSQLGDEVVDRILLEQAHGTGKRADRLYSPDPLVQAFCAGANYAANGGDETTLNKLEAAGRAAAEIRREDRGERTEERLRPVDLLSQESLARVACALQELGVEETLADCKAATVICQAIEGADRSGLEGPDDTGGGPENLQTSDSEKAVNQFIQRLEGEGGVEAVQKDLGLTRPAIEFVLRAAISHTRETEGGGEDA